MTKRKLIWGLILVGLVVIVPYGLERRAQLTRGYCFAEKRYLTDKEIIDAAVLGAIEIFNRQQNALPEEERSSDLQFSSVEDFYNKNPYCCYPMVEGARRHIRAGPVEIDDLGGPVYRPSLRITVSNKPLMTNALAITPCGEFKSPDIKLRFSASSSLEVGPHDPRPDRRK